MYFPGLGNHSMARYEKGDRIDGDGAGNGPECFRMTNIRSNILVADDAPLGDIEQGLPYVDLKIGPLEQQVKRSRRLLFIHPEYTLDKRTYGSRFFDKLGIGQRIEKLIE